MNSNRRSFCRLLIYIVATPILHYLTQEIKSNIILNTIAKANGRNIALWIPWENDLQLGCYFQALNSCPLTHMASLGTNHLEPFMQKGQYNPKCHSLHYHLQIKCISKSHQVTNLLLIFKRILFLNYVYGVLHRCLWKPKKKKKKKKVSDPPGLKIQVTETCSTWVLGTELWTLNSLLTPKPSL